MRKSSLSKPREKLMFTIGHDGKKLYIEIRGKRITGTPQAKTWVSLEPGWRVFDNADRNKLTIEYRDHEDRLRMAVPSRARACARARNH